MSKRQEAIERVLQIAASMSELTPQQAREITITAAVQILSQPHATPEGISVFEEESGATLIVVARGPAVTLMRNLLELLREKQAEHISQAMRGPLT